MDKLYWDIIEAMPHEGEYSVFGGSMSEAVQDTVRICELICSKRITSVEQFKALPEAAAYFVEYD